MNTKDIDTLRAPTGVAGLDLVLNGGLPRGHLYLLEGVPGAGKTTLALQFLLDGARRGESTLYVTLSETRAETEKIAASHGWDISGITIFDLATSVSSVSLDDQYTVFSPSEVELGDTTRRILTHFEEVKATRVVIDSVSELQLLAHDSLRYRRQILGLKHYFAARGATVLLLDDGSNRHRDLQTESIAHGIIELERIASQYGAERRRLKVGKLRGTAYKGGYHDFILRQGGLEVFPRLTSADHPVATHQNEPVASGIPGFDELMGGGLDRGTSTLILGPAGTGKSSVVIKMADAAVKRGERVAIFAFEENQRIIARRASALGIALNEHIAQGSISFKHIDPAELSPGEFAGLVRHAVEVRGARMIVIDSLNGYLNAMPEEQFLLAQLHELLAYLNHHNVVTILIMAQRGLVGAGMTSPVDLSYLADSVVLLRNFEAFGSVKKAISVLKKRTGPHEETIRELKFRNGELALGAVLRDFSGILTGVPTYLGNRTNLSEGAE